MTRDQAVARARHCFDSGAFRDDLARLIAVPTESQNPERISALRSYAADEIRPRLEQLGFVCTMLTHPSAEAPFLYAERIEDAARPTILGYGHGDVIRGLADLWSEGLSPWRLTERDGRWYGRGVADNKGQHAINLAAMKAVIGTRGKLGFNAKYLIEMGEEVGSPGLRELCTAERERFASDALIASDGPRVTAARPTMFLGTRGVATFDLTITARDGGHHSGNWGGILSDPAIQLAHAIGALATRSGKILVEEWLPGAIPPAVVAALADLSIDGGPDAPAIDADWGEPGLSPEEQVFGWCSFDVLAMSAGNPETPVNAVPPSAWARCQLRFVVGVDPAEIVPSLRRHLARHGWDCVAVREVDEISAATRLDPGDPWVLWAAASMARTTGRRPAILPNLGGSLPNDIFAHVLGLRTLWIPHSYAGCQQHGPDEHMPLEIVREGLAIMAGLYWDLGEPGAGAVADPPY